MVRNVIGASPRFSERLLACRRCGRFAAFAAAAGAIDATVCWLPGDDASAGCLASWLAPAGVISA